MRQWLESTGTPLTRVYQDRERLSPVATEFLITAASGGTCVVKIVTSAFGTGSDWENEFFSEMVASSGPIFDRLATYFKGTKAP